MSVASAAVQPRPLCERTGSHHRLKASTWPRGAPVPADLATVKDPGARGPMTAGVVLDVTPEGAVPWRSLVAGHGAACVEEVELWDRADAVLVAVGSTAVMLDARTGAVRARVPAGGYLNGILLAEDGRDAYVCGDENVVRVLPDGTVAWTRALGVDGVMVHRAVGLTVFCSAQKRVGGPWADYLLDRSTGAVTEAPEPEEEAEQKPAAPAAAKGAAQKPAAPAGVPGPAQDGVKTGKPRAVPPAAPEEDPDELDDDSAVKMVRDDESEPDDE